MIEVWGVPLDGILWYCVGGGSFFSGCLLLITVLFAGLFAAKTWHNFLIYFAAAISAFFIYMSATPLSSGLYIIWALTTLGGLLAIGFKSAKKRKLILTAFGMTLLAFFIELPNYITPSIPPLQTNRLFVIGDSISDGIGTKDERTWPKIMTENGYEVTDLARAGATSVTALRRQVDGVTDDEGIVILEIGGNDALMGTPIKEYENSLRQILDKVLTDRHKVIMLEAPVLPWHIEYARVMRKVAGENEVILIPKKLMAGVFSAKDATVDLAHLSAKGHELMAQEMLSLIEQKAK